MQRAVAVRTCSGKKLNGMRGDAWEADQKGEMMFGGILSQGGRGGEGLGPSPMTDRSVSLSMTARWVQGFF